VEFIRNRLFKELFALFVVKWMQGNRLRYTVKNEGGRARDGEKEVA